MSNDELAKLYAYMDRRLDVIEQKLDKKADADVVYRMFDAIAARLGIDDHERLALTSQVNRHEIWIKQLAKKTNTDVAS